MNKPLPINVKIEITQEEKNWLKSYCQAKGIVFQWHLGQLVKNEIKRLKAEEE